MASRLAPEVSDGRRDQALLVLSPTGHVSRLMNAMAPGIYQRLMARTLKKELER